MNSKQTKNIDSILTEFHQSFIIYPDVDKIFEGLDWINRRSQFGKFVPSMLITGGTGAGKSSLVERYLRQNFVASEYLVTGVRPSFAETLVWAIDRLKVPYNSHSKRSEIGLQDYFIGCVKRSKLKLLVVEEAQQLFECASEKERQKIRDRLKMISDECRLPIVFVGIPTAKLILEDSQWDRRIMVKRELPYIRITNEETLDVYIALLEGFEQVLPIPVSPQLLEMEIAMRLLAASRGMIGLLKELVGYALELALRETKNEITIEDFTIAFETINGVNVNNPFKMELDKLMIPQIIEYEDYIIDPDSGDIKFTKQIFKEVSMTELLS